MLIGDEVRSLVSVFSLLLHVKEVVDAHHDNARNGQEEGEALPQLHPTYNIEVKSKLAKRSVKINRT
jgi:hypothetical protein